MLGYVNQHEEVVINSLPTFLSNDKTCSVVNLTYVQCKMCWVHGGVTRNSLIDVIWSRTNIQMLRWLTYVKIFVSVLVCNNTLSFNTVRTLCEEMRRTNSWNYKIQTYKSDHLFFLNLYRNLSEQKKNRVGGIWFRLNFLLKIVPRYLTAQQDNCGLIRAHVTEIFEFVPRSVLQSMSQ